MGLNSKSDDVTVKMRVPVRSAGLANLGMVDDIQSGFES